MRPGSDFSDLEMLRVIGRGSFGVVNLARLKGESVAVKSIVVSSRDDIDLVSLPRNVEPKKYIVTHSNSAGDRGLP